MDSPFPRFAVRGRRGRELDLRRLEGNPRVPFPGLVGWEVARSSGARTSLVRSPMAHGDGGAGEGTERRGNARAREERGAQGLGVDKAGDLTVDGMGAAAMTRRRGSRWSK